jgi:hypothetical protein
MPGKQRKLVRPLTEAQAKKIAEKRAKRRQARNKNKSGDSVKPRSTATIINNLTKSMNNMNMQGKQASKPYVQARLSCCVPRSLPRVPDGNPTKALRMCFYAIDRLSFTGSGPQTANLLFNPWLPCPGMVISPSSDSIVLNGFTLPLNPGLIGAGFGMPAKFAGLPKTYTAPGSTSNAFDVYSASTIRIVAQTHAIRYTGPVNTCSGVVRAWEAESSLTEGGEVTTYSATSTQPTTGVSGQVFGTGTLWTRSVPIGTQILLFDGSGSTTVPASAVSARPEQGMTLRLPHKTDVYKFVPVANVPPLVSPATSMSSTTAVNLYDLFFETTTNLPNIFAYDNDWTGMCVLLDNVNADASFSIETCVCVEIVPSNASAFYPLADTHATTDVGAMKFAQKEISTKGSAIAGIH